MIDQNQFMSRALIYGANMHTENPQYKYEVSPILSAIGILSKALPRWYKKLIVDEESITDLSTEEKGDFIYFTALLLDAMTGQGFQTPTKIILRHLENVMEEGASPKKLKKLKKRKKRKKRLK